MKRILALLLLLPLLASAKVASVRLDTSSTNLTVHFADASGKIALPSFVAINTLMIDNRTNGEVVVNCSLGLASVPSDTSVANVYIGPGEAYVPPDSAGFTPYCYWRSFSGTISTGIVAITAVGR